MKTDLRQSVPLAIFACAITLVTSDGCSTGPIGRHTPAKPPALLDAGAFPADYREAVSAIAGSLVNGGEDPKEFCAEVESRNGGGILVFHLWHVSAFKPERINTAGNPGGKCRDVWYDAKRHEVTQTVWWQ